MISYCEFFRCAGDGTGGESIYGGHFPGKCVCECVCVCVCERERKVESKCLTEFTLTGNVQYFTI